MEKMEIGCGKPTGAVVGEPAKDEVIEQEEENIYLKICSPRPNDGLHFGQI